METLIVLVVLSVFAYFVIKTRKPEWLELIKSKFKK
jgi:heme/copper-type cytochrome/quinol oxidase subunit 2